MHSVPSPSASKPQISDYTRIRARSIRFLILLAAVLALAFFLSLRAGSYNTPAAELIRGIFGRATDNKINLVIRNNRLPRICTAMVSGAGLGLAGCILQAVLRNPLASASTLGVSQGAMLALQLTAECDELADTDKNGDLIPLGGVMIVAGCLLNAAEVDNHPSLSKPEFILIHGSEDTTVPFGGFVLADKTLFKNGQKTVTKVVWGRDHTFFEKEAMDEILRLAKPWGDRTKQRG